MKKLLQKILTSPRELMLVCAGEGFRCEGTFSPEFSSEETLALVASDRKDSISLIATSAVTYLEFRQRSDLQKILGTHGDLAPSEEVEKFKKTFGELTKLNLERKLAELNETRPAPKLRVNWSGAPSTEFCFNVASLALVLQEKSAASGEPLFREAFLALDEITFAPGTGTPKKEGAKVVIALPDNNFNSASKTQTMFDQFESIL